MPARPVPDLPSGTVTFLFTDIEGSTQLVSSLGDSYGPVLEAHADLIRKAIADHAGTEVSTEGDAFFAVFRSAPEAVGAAADAQRALATHPWPGGASVRVRMGLHTGTGLLGGDSYVGIDVHRAARIAAAGYGGQVLLSETTRALVEQALPEGLAVRDLAEHRLKDLPAPERIWQLGIAGLSGDFPAIH
jgi:class 3 adenylate cyclase